MILKQQHFHLKTSCGCWPNCFFIDHYLCMKPMISLQLPLSPQIWLDGYPQKKETACLEVWVPKKWIFLFWVPLIHIKHTFCKQIGEKHSIPGFRNGKHDFQMVILGCHHQLEDHQGYPNIDTEIILWGLPRKEVDWWFVSNWIELSELEWLLWHQLHQWAELIKPGCSCLVATTS